MQSLAVSAPVVNNQEEFNTGYALYVKRKPIEACRNAEQRRGWKYARRGEMACDVVDTVFAFGGDGIDADVALATWGRV